MQSGQRVNLGFTVTLSYRGVRFSSEFPWKVSVVSFMAFPAMMQEKGSVPNNLLKILTDPFFDAIELPSVSSADWDKVKSHVTGKVLVRGLQPDILTNKLDINNLDLAQRREALRRIKGEIDLASSLGIRMVGICSGPDPGFRKRREASKKIVQSLIEICRHASERQASVALETFDRDYDKKLLIGPLKEGAEIVRKVRRRCSNIGLMWDLSHAPMLKETPEDLKKVAGLLAHIHVGCSKKTAGGFIDSHPGFHTAGAVNSDNDVAELLKVLLAIKYEGMIGFEVKPEPDQTGEQVLTDAKGVLTTAYRSVTASILKSK